MKRQLTFLLLLAACQPLVAQQVAPFKSGDRVVFAGNSITEAGLYAYDIWLYYITRFPDRPIRIINGGIGGNVAGQIYDRMDGDLLVHDPTVMVVTFGMNDSRYFEYGDTTKTGQVIGDAVATSKKSFDRIVSRLQQLPKVRKVMMTSSPYDESMANKDNYFRGKSIAMERIAEIQEEAAEANHWDFVDLMRPMTAINERGQAKKADFTIIGPDRIHPGSAGHLVMAYLFLKTQGLAGQPIADISVDASSGRASRQENASVRRIKNEGDGLSFDYRAASLPFPIDPHPRVWQNFQTQAEALDVVPFMNEFNRERLAVTGLEQGRYAVLIDGTHIVDVSAEALAAGINLAEYPGTPQYQQAIHLMDLSRRHRELEGKYRNYMWVQYDFLKEKGMLFDDSDAARDTALAHAESNLWLKSKLENYEAVRVTSSRNDLDRQMAQLRKQLYRGNKPVTRRITIRKN